jgi:hypothetical protein
MQRRTGAAKERSGPGANRPQMAVPLTAEDEEFRGRIRSWLEVNLSGEFAAPRGLGALAVSTSTASGAWPGTVLGWRAAGGAI